MSKKFGLVKFWLVILSFLFAVGVQGQLITVTDLTPPSPVCRGSNVIITFNATNGNEPLNTWFSTNTRYVFYLTPNPNGQPRTKTAIDTLNVTNVPYVTGNGNITVGLQATLTIPATQVPRNNYVIGIDAFNPPSSNLFSKFSLGSNSGISSLFTVSAPGTTANAGPNREGGSTCGLDTIHLQGNTATVGTGMWTLSPDNVSAGGQITTPSSPNSPFSGTKNSEYILRWTITNGGCSTFSDARVRLNTAPSVAHAGPGQSICGDLTTTLVANTPDSGTGVWTFIPGSDSSGGSFGNRFDPHSTLTGVVGQTYALQWTISTVCSSNSNNVNVKFSSVSLPAPSVVLGKKDASSCGNGVNGIIKGFVNGGVSPYTFSFPGGTQTLIGTTGLEVRDLPAGNYVMRVTDANGCTAAEDTTIIQSPTPSIEVSTRADVSSCGTSDGFFTIRVFPRTGITATGIKPFFFQETVQGADTAGVPYVQIAPTIKFSNLAEGQYQVIMKDSAGCSSNFLQDITIGKDNQPALSLLTKANLNSCNNGGYIIVKASEGRTPYSYSLSNDGGQTWIIQNQSSNSFAGLGHGIYTAKVTDAAGCESPLLTPITQGFSITATTRNVLTCGGSTGYIFVTASNGVLPYTYSLSKDNGITFGTPQTSRTFTLLPAGNMYAVKATDANNCESNIIKNITITEPAGCMAAVSGPASNLSIMAKNSLNLAVLPNPTRTAFTLNLQSSSKEKVQIVVTDMFGKKLYQTTGGSSQQYTFGNGFASGVYIVQVIQGKQIQTLKLVKGN